MGELIMAVIIGYIIIQVLFFVGGFIASIFGWEPKE
jgi:hypothetical protein